jgi:hypothetical protein
MANLVGGAHNFDQWEREDQLRAFFAWLPFQLHDAPGVNWSLLPASIMGYCIRNMGTSPDADYLAMAIASAHDVVSPNSLMQLLGNLHALLTTLRTVCGMERVCDLRSETIWNAFAAKTGTTMSRSRQLSSYSAVSLKHYPRYLRGLEAGDYLSMQQYQLPPMPHDFLKRVGKAYALNKRSRIRQQSIREMLSPLFPLLLRLVWSRKQLAERVLHAYRQALQHAETAAPLPLPFSHVDSLPLVIQRAGDGWEIHQRAITMRFFLWNKRAWILAHQDRYSGRVITEAEQASGIYSPERDQFFVQFAGNPQDVLWFGDLIMNRLLQQFQRGLRDDPRYEERWKIARDHGFPHGCTTQQPGLLRNDSRWFAEHTMDGDVLFEPEAIYRGILYAAALATLAMTSGGSVSELLQMSAGRWVETPEGRQQRLLPERARGEDARRLFKVSPEAGQLLGEIEQGLVETYGEIPVIGPSRQITKFDQLQHERYFFQWHRCMVDPHDTNVLLRFLLYGVNLASADGRALRFSMEQIRYGGNRTQEERAHALMYALGFYPSMLTHLSSASREVYSRDFFAYFTYAGSKEAALRPLTLAQWVVHLMEKGYERGTINHMVFSVQQMYAAAASHGLLDQAIASSFQSMKKLLPAEKVDSSTGQEETEPRLSFSAQFKSCGKPYCVVCREGKRHGPYWYAYRRGEGLRVYIGREKNDRTIAEALRKFEQRRAEKPAPHVQVPQKAQRDSLIPLVPALCRLIWSRKLLAGRVLAAVRQVQQRVLSGEATLPIRFQLAEMIPELRFDPQSGTSGTIEERVVILDCSLWDKRSWVLMRQDRFSRTNISLALRGVNAYSQERNTFFLQFHGPPVDLLWFGDLVEQNLLRMLGSYKAHDEESVRRYREARDLGFPRGCHTTRAGLLDTSDRWFAENAGNGDLIFEPEAIYRGSLYGAALALLSLSAGMGIGELLQVRADRWVVQQTAEGAGTPEPIYLQSLVPSGAQVEDGRHLYPVSPEAKRLLDEITHELVQAHGEVPLVHPCLHATQPGSLRPERYLFQWQRGMVDPHEFVVLQRFILYGLRAPTGERLHITADLLRESATVPALRREHELKRLCDSLLEPLAPGLTRSSLKSYQQDVLAYLRFAGSAEQAYVPGILRQWIAYLSHGQPGRPYDSDAIDKKITPVRRCLREAGKMGLLDRERAEEFTSIKVQRHPIDSDRRRGPAPKVNETIKRWLTDFWQATPGGLTGEELRSAYTLAFGGDISTATLYNALAQLNLRKTPPPTLTADDEAWIVEQCERDPGVSARELREKLETERGKQIDKKELNKIRAKHGVRRPSDSPPRVQPQRPASYKLEEDDIEWLLQQRRDHPALSGPKLQAQLREQRGKEIGDHAINIILRKRGLSKERKRRA